MNQPANQPFIHIQGLTKRFGTRTLWQDINLDIERGEMVALTGPSGSGKSTLLNCIGLLEPTNQGSITINQRNTSRFGHRASRIFRRDQLGYLFQNYALIDNATARFNLEIALGAQPKAKQRAESIEDALQHVGLGGRGREPVFQLSGGEQQRVALARLIVKKPTVVLADEPTGALDAKNADMVIASLREMAESGCSVIIATHSNHVSDSCDRIFDLTIETT